MVSQRQSADRRRALPFDSVVGGAVRGPVPWYGDRARRPPGAAQYAVTPTCGDVTTAGVGKHGLLQPSGAPARSEVPATFPFVARHFLPVGGFS